MPVSNVEVGMQVEADPVRSLAHYQEASYHCTKAFNRI
jgi:hypothetical protein